MSNLTPSTSTDYSLFKATRMLKSLITTQLHILKNDNTWARSTQEKADVFAAYLDDVFKANMLHKSVESLATQRLDEAHQLDLPIKKFTCSKFKVSIKNLKEKKEPRYDLITPKILKELPEEGKKFLTPQWKVVQIRIILKPIFLKRLMPFIDEKEIIPRHQFGFRKQHSTLEQVHRLVEVI